MLSDRIRTSAAVLFLTLQLCLVIGAQFTSRRYFCWAPNDYANTFTVQVTLNGNKLSEEQALLRYQLQDRKLSYENPASHIIDLIRQYEQTYGRNDGAEVLLKWSLNGHEEQTWRWPQP